MLSRRELLSLPLAALAGCVAVKDFMLRPGPYRDEGVHHVGNSTHLIVLDGKSVLTDPWLKEPADKILKHRVPPAPLPTEPDLVLVTHAHEDHFDEAALALVHKTAPIVVPVWLEDRARALGFSTVVTLKDGDVVELEGFRIQAANALHDIPEIAYRLERRGKSVFFGGDTLPTKEIAALPPVDFAILPADAGALLGKRWVMNIEEAVAMAERFGAHGAMLTHHEMELVSPLWSAIVDIQPPDVKKLPPWFVAPTPGEHVPFPWSRS